MDKGRRIAETNDPRSADRTEIHTETIETTETKGSSSPNQGNKKDVYPKGQAQAKSMPGKIVRGYATPVSRGSIAATNVWNGALELLLRALNGKIFQVRMEEITRYIAEKHRLEVIIAGEKRRVVPMKPATLEKLVVDFREYGRKTADPFEKKKVLEVLIKLESMREESYAMWK